MLSALLRTLDLRDRMTARHSAAVARYSREIAAAAGFSPEDQELVHSAGLLHDIGKFVLPDDILKSGAPPAHGRRVGGDQDAPLRGRADRLPDRRLPADRRDHPRPPRAHRRQGLPARARRETRSPSWRKIISVADTYDVMTARDTYREPVSSYEAWSSCAASPAPSSTPASSTPSSSVLEGKDLAYRHGEDADFEAELAPRQAHPRLRSGDAGRRRTRRLHRP